jgi:photosynthetic reaction center cytochrome c subunit
MKFESIRTIASALTTVVLCLLGVGIASGQTGQDPKPQMAEEVFKNVQFLKGIPVDEFMDTMGMISNAVGLNCLDCHTGDSDISWERFAADTTMKQTSRRMIQMVNTINRGNFRGQPVVTCYTCHHGDLKPKSAANLGAQYGTPFEDPNEDIAPVRGGPSAEEILDKYFQALGGQQRVSGLNSIAAKGTYTGFDTHHTKVPVEIYAKAPAQRTLIIHTAFADRVSVYDGGAGWVAAIEKPLPLLPLTGANLAGARIEAMASFPAQLKQAFNQWRVGSTTIGDREVRVLQGMNPGQSPVNLYFDDSGLLMRLVRFADTPIGRVPTQIDYEDYREISGVKIPFRWISTWTDGQATIEFTDVQVNVPIDATKFARPAPARTRAQ